MLKNRLAALTGSCYFQDRPQSSALWPVEYKQVHARGVLGILRALQQPGFNESIDGLGDLLGVVPDEGGELFISQKRARVAMQKYQQIEFAGTAYDGGPGQQARDLVGILTLRQWIRCHKGTAVSIVLAALPLRSLAIIYEFREIRNHQSRCKRRTSKLLAQFIPN